MHVLEAEIDACVRERNRVEVACEVDGCGERALARELRFIERNLEPLRAASAGPSIGLHGERRAGLIIGKGA